MHRYLEASLPVFRELGDDFNLSSYLGVLTLTALAEGDADEARALAEEALEAGAAGAQSDEARRTPWRRSASCSGVQGEFDDAPRVLEESVRRARELGNLRSVGRWTKALGGITFLQGNYPRARELFEQSLAILRSLDDAWGTLGSLSGLALVALEEHDNELGAAPAEREPRAPAEERPPLSIGERPRDRRQARRRPGSRPPRRSPVRSGERLSRIDSRRMFECEVWPDPAPHIARLRSTLGERAFDETWAQGTAMTLDQSLAYAQDEADIERA